MLAVALKGPLYDQIGMDYDVTRRADRGIVERLLYHLSPQMEHPHLDIACGTGNYTSAIARTGVRMVGLDQSPEMLAKARKKCHLVQWVLGNAEKIPFPTGSFYGGLCTFAIYLFPAIDPILAEAFRVLHGGNLVIFTFAPEQVRGYWLNEYFPKSMARVAHRMPSRTVLTTALTRAGFSDVHFESYEVSPEVEDRFLFSGKHHPRRYLDPQFRAGISAFVTLGEKTEIAHGCERLRADLESGRFEEIKQAHPGIAGDCLFVIARKK